jgi:hypothetical protein
MNAKERMEEMGLERNRLKNTIIQLGFEILSIHNDIIIASKRFIYGSDIKLIESYVDSWYIFDNKLFVSVKLTKPLVIDDFSKGKSDIQTHKSLDKFIG